MQTADYNPLDWKCPRRGCEAKPGEPCRDRSGREREPHMSRVRALKPTPKQVAYLRGLRTELGIADESVPATKKEAWSLIAALVARRDEMRDEEAELDSRFGALVVEGAA